MRKELYGMEKVIGKPVQDMDLNDIEIAAKGCELQPLHAKEEVLTENYLRSLVYYFPHVVQCLVDKYLLGSEYGGHMSKALKKFGIQHRGLRARTYLLEQVTFVLWATGDLQTALKYYDGKQKAFTAGKHNLPFVHQPATEPNELPTETPAEPPAPTPTTTTPKREASEPYVPGRRANTVATVELYGAPEEILTAMAYIAGRFALDVQKSTLCNQNPKPPTFGGFFIRKNAELNRRITPIHRHNQPRHIRCLARGQEHRRRIQLSRLPIPLHRHMNPRKFLKLRRIQYRLS